MGTDAVAPANVEALVRLLLRHPEGLQRQEVARRTGLAANTIAALLKPGKQLTEAGLILEEQADQAGSDGGRRPFVARLDSCGLYLGCVEVAHGHARCGLTDIFGRLLPAGPGDNDCYDELVSPSVSTDPTGTLDWIERRLKARLAAVFENERARARDGRAVREAPLVVSVGVSAAGPVDPRNGKLRCANPRDDAGFSCGPWRGTSIGSSLEDRLVGSQEWRHCEFYTENDANLCAIAELHGGVLRNHSHAIVVKWTGGVGGAVVLGGDVYVGAEGFAGEFGHSHLGDDEEALTLGQRIGIAALSRRLRPTEYDAFRKGSDDCGLLLRDWFVEHILELARADEKLPEGESERGVGTPRKEIRRAAAELGRALVPHVDMLNPEVIVITGGVFTARDRSLITDPLTNSLRANTTHFSSNEVDVIFAKHYKHPALDGAIASRLTDERLPTRLLAAVCATDAPDAPAEAA